MTAPFNGELARGIGGFVPAEAFWTSSSRDGARIQSWLQRPRGVAQPPLILSIHGGPFACYGDRFSIKHQAFLAAGYAVLTVNPRGSIGYGEDFANLLHDAHPGPDWHDLMDALDAAVRMDGIDPDRLFVTGTSGGGALTLWSVTHTHRFRAAVSIKPVVNQASWMLTADIGAMLGATWFAGERPWQNPEKFRARSPLAFVADAKTPTLLIAGEEDHRTPSSEAQQMFTALRLCGVPTALMRMPEVRYALLVRPLRPKRDPIR
jgi:dipeptidyl aminopeptidase/acylaminoacyl peptidase